MELRMESRTLCMLSKNFIPHNAMPLALLKHLSLILVICFNALSQKIQLNINKKIHLGQGT